jgi:hypothetical protein
LISLATFFLVLLIPAILLNINKIQNLVIDKVTLALEKELNTTLSIGHIDLRWFNHLKLDDFYIEDQAGDTLATIDELDVKISLLALLRKEIKIHNASISKLSVNLKTDADHNSNINFLIEAFKDTTQKSSMDFDIKEVKLHECAFSMTQSHIKDSLHGQSIFQPQHIVLSDINTQIVFTKHGDHNFSGSIDYLNFKEHSGFEIKNISTSFACNDTLCRIPETTVELPNTALKIGETKLNYKNWDTLISDFSKVKIKTEILPSNIYLPDLRFFSKELNNLRQPVEISGTIKGKVSNIKASALNVKYGDNISFLGNFQISGLPSIHEIFIFANIDYLKFNKNGLQDIIANLSQTPTVLPQEFSHIGNCTYKGQITGFIGNMVAYGKLQSGIGQISTDVSLQVSKDFKKLAINGLIKSSHLNIGQVLPAQTELGAISFTASASLTTGASKKVKGSMDFHINSLQFKNYTYQDIHIKGKLNNRNFVGNINLDDENLKFNFNGDVNLNNKLSAFRFDASVTDFRPYELHLTDKYPNLCASLQLSSDFETSSIDNVNGVISIDSLKLSNNNKHYSLNNISLTSKVTKSNHIEIKSDFISGFISGNYTITSLKNSLLNIASKTLPIINNITTYSIPQNDNNLKFFIEIEDTKQLCDVFEIPWALRKHTMISGFLNDKTSDFGVDCYISKLNNNTTNINNINLKIRNENKKLLMLANAVTKIKNDTLSLFMDIEGMQDTLVTHIEVENSQQNIINAGELLFKTYLQNSNEGIIANTHIFPTDIVADNKTWNIAPADISTNFKWLTVKGFSIKSDDDQNIIINGKASTSKEDKIDINLNDINLDYISSLLPDDSSVEFGGRVSGAATVYSAFDIPLFNADVTANDFVFNRSHFGKAHATSNFDFTNKTINFYGVVTNNDEKQDTTAILTGAYFLMNDSLDIKGDARRLDLRFLSYYLHTIFDDVQGKGTGQVHIHGFSKTMQTDVEVKAFAEDALLKVAYLQSAFTFSDSIILTPTEILLRNIEIKDMHGNKGHINGKLSHRFFQNMDYRINIDCDHLQVLNTTKQDNPDFYGTAFATGKAVIQGNDKGTHISCNAKTERNSRLIIPMGEASAAQNNFITFVDNNTYVVIDDEETKKNDKKKTQETDLTLNLLLDVTPDAEIQLLLNPQAGDMIRATGYGNLQINYSSVGEQFKILGGYEIESGNYLFTFQNALRKEFKVENGGKLNWSGDPANPTIDLKAYYQLTASLKDILDETILNKSNRTTVPVQCILQLSGTLNAPIIKFDINLPNSDEELNRALDAVVSTEEMMNRQIISLLIIGKFYAPELVKTSTGLGQSDLLAIVSSTLSSQLNNWASQIFDKWNFGVNFRTTGTANTQDFGQEYEFNFLYMPNDRITFNGNVGYRNDNLNTSNFIGDFDFEYKLIQSGKLSLKAYTHTNDYKEFKTGLTTQGIGLVYKENFGSLKELFANWKQSLTPKTPEEKAAIKAQREKEKAEKKAIHEWRKRERAEAQAKYDAEKKAMKEQKKLDKEKAKEEKKK